MTEDLIFVDYCSFFQIYRADGTKYGRTPLEHELFGHGLSKIMNKLYMYARMDTRSLPRPRVEASRVGRLCCRERFSSWRKCLARGAASRKDLAHVRALHSPPTRNVCFTTGATRT